MKEMTLDVRGMSCGHCVKTIEGSVRELPGVRKVKVDLQNAQVSVSYDEATSSPSTIKETIKEQGYGVA
ncbi:Copper-ion-binding protein [Bhargavaea cecembensis DSE10]|uniref:Copper chaperone CopZ n=1 Tax=Bhargavaea cecembensis DSE10 TaxID=1235279 RepID=M7P9T0_9BACL|nr:copper chaperone CopZ [Bhargavaea cecembensis]EMR07244.1 Copper-ion-binding protein [Bhargavaea cecembensis DSE10]